MLKSHLYRIFHNKLSIIMMLVMIFIPCIEVVQLLNVQEKFGDHWHPAYAFFLAGSSRGHMTQTILLWFLPIFLLIISAEDSIQDFKTGYRQVLVNKIGIKKYCIEKIGCAFLVSFFIMFITLFINFILVCVIFANGTYDKGLSEMVTSSEQFLYFSVSHPYIMDILYSLLCCLFAGLAGAIGASFSLLFRDRKYAYTAAFFIWFMLILKKHSLMFLFQPFSEYGLDVLFPILLLASIVLILIPLIVYVYEVKFNEV